MLSGRGIKDVIPAWPESFFVMLYSFIKSIIQKDSRQAGMPEFFCSLMYFLPQPA
jgi:hypothetical protein